MSAEQNQDVLPVRSVWKFPIVPMSTNFSVGVPYGAGGPINPLMVDLDPSGVPCMWFEVEPGAAPVVRHFAIVGTGHAVTPAHHHVGSFKIDAFVFHIYEKSVI